MTHELYTAYSDAIYHIFPNEEWPEGYDIFVGDRNRDLNHWLNQKKFNHWVYITAWNPGSKELDLKENSVRNQRLMKDILELGLSCMDGIGKATDDSWMEVSFFVPGMPLPEGLRLAKKYGQLAIIHGSVNKTAVLTFL